MNTNVSAIFLNVNNLFTRLRKCKLKGIVHPKMKISPWFTHSKAILWHFSFRRIQRELY